LLAADPVLTVELFNSQFDRSIKAIGLTEIRDGSGILSKAFTLRTGGDRGEPGGHRRIDLRLCL
jgi:hypothetical protein